jgi:hypothetical protein
MDMYTGSSRNSMERFVQAAAWTAAGLAALGLEGAFGYLAAFPGSIGGGLSKGVAAGGIVAATAGIFILLHFLVRGMGRNYYSFGTVGYMLKLIGGLFLLMPVFIAAGTRDYLMLAVSSLPAAYFCGRGIRRKLLD